jgi:hypothetical protein
LHFLINCKITLLDSTKNETKQKARGILARIVYLSIYLGFKFSIMFCSFYVKILNIYHWNFSLGIWCLLMLL